ncbi:hypothetical protein BDB00DRAFT_858726 [Zychaea mexicana]|uniref:uncharacterized protein n=1 Tax=Zychaea mexicana TaxID=64656 RepID=UPI0022FE130E|nr:uncharacterized protein BDB00DRAFT_858726 [Zychaea mexicana]KAI9479532.1 hypothetical protein BDB00DRAFT_858726 [Zychaea mexicana]
MSAFVPPVQHGMTVLNREAFKKSVSTLAMRVQAKRVGDLMKKLSSELLNQPRLRNVVNGSDDTKLLLLRSDLRQEDIPKLPEEIRTVIEQASVGFEQHTIDLDYSYWTADQLLHAVIPAEDAPASYTQIGHIAHMNLKEEFYPWKNLIGQVILDKNKNITTVVNKTNNIDTTFRFFQMEILAGEDNMIAQVKESGCRFKFDFSKVYWNSRLHTEHDRLIQKFKKNEYICDVFAGVGPFALPAAKKGAIVYANDLNPASYQWLNENIKLNKITKGIHPYNLDGREFIRKAVEDLQATSEEWKTFDHFVMNLPATAIEFLDTFHGLYRDQKVRYDASQSAKLPMIHCHCFTKSSEPANDILERASQVIGAPIDRATSVAHWVRNVAPKKDMYCLSFRLSPEVAFASNGKRKLEADDNKADEAQQKTSRK